MIGKALVLAGITIAVIGVVFMLGEKIPWLGKLPGDIYVHKNNFSFYFPLATSIIISIIISLVLILIKKI